MGKQIEFRLTEKRTPASWTISGGYAVKEGYGTKLINYFPGSDSIFVEDQKSDIKAQEVTFTYNDILSDPATSILVDENNKALINYLKAHSFFNVHYYIHNEDQLAENKLANLDKIEKAFSLIKENEDLKVQAMALAIFKEEAYGWTATKCKAELKEKATTNPDIIINAMESDRYESKYLSALAFYSGIVKEDQLKGAVIWNDEDGNTILRLAKGENGITKLGELLSTKSDASVLVLQEIGIRLNKNENLKNTTVNAAETVTGKTEAQIKEEAIAEYKASLAPSRTEEEIRAEILAEMAKGGPAKEEVNNEPSDLAKAQEKYKEVKGKDVPPRFANDINWLNAKISEKGI